MCVVTKKGVHLDYPRDHHLADLLSVSIQKRKNHYSFVGFMSSVYCILVTYGPHRKKEQINNNNNNNVVAER